jgi:hypothetical protein
MATILYYMQERVSTVIHSYSNEYTRLFLKKGIYIVYAFVYIKTK